MADPTTLKLPQSVTDIRINLIGLVAMLIATALLLDSEMYMVDVAALLMAAAVGPILLLDVLVHKVHRRPSTGLDWDRPRGPVDWGRIATKWVGAASAVLALGAFYALAPEYQGSFYDQFYLLLWRFGPPVAGLAAVYIAWLDGRMVDPQDGYWHAGAVLLGRWDAVAWDKLADFGRTWVIKGFFIPLMFIFLTRNLTELRHHVADHPESFMAWFDTLWSLGFLVDIVFTTAGYLITLRVLDTHVRSAQPTMWGWVVALICYQPFFSLINRFYIFYNNGFGWDQWLGELPALRMLWGAVLMGTTVVFAWSTVAFGARFSNLTNRGVITGGPYRWTKHPAYLSKCLGFWMLYIPFVPHTSAYEVVRDCFWLTVLCGVYFARARTEEAHLSEDPDYVQYGLWMNEHGVLAPLGRWIPALRYRPPA